MYGSFGVKKGYLPFMPGAMCIDGDSLISFGYGFSRKIKDLMMIETTNLWTYNTRNSSLPPDYSISDGNGIKYNGKRDVVKVTLFDGRTIRCTPDHRIMTTIGWVQAGDLLSQECKVIIGHELPEDVMSNDEQEWRFTDFTMDNPQDRERSLAFARVLGLVFLADRLEVVQFTHKLDAEIFVNDLKLITGRGKKIENDLSVKLPKSLIDRIVAIEVPSGQELPNFILDETCPLALIREFLGAVFGLMETENASQYMMKIMNLLERFELHPLENIYRWNSILFAEKIGFRYSVEKNCKLSIASSYLKYLKFQFENHRPMCDADAFIDATGYDEHTYKPFFHLSIESVEPDGIADVYDILDVPNQAFFANGLVVHNCTTHMGRTNIKRVAKALEEKYQGQLVYGDTDSNYISFPHLTTAQETW
jgi:hypothetical protein